MQLPMCLGKQFISCPILLVAFYMHSLSGNPGVIFRTNRVRCVGLVTRSCCLEAFVTSEFVTVTEAPEGWLPVKRGAVLHE